eukprot:7327020-Alexandrium_andersonii.AAC.1
MSPARCKAAVERQRGRLPRGPFRARRSHLRRGACDGIVCGAASGSRRAPTRLRAALEACEWLNGRGIWLSQGADKASCRT